MCDPLRGARTEGAHPRTRTVTPSGSGRRTVSPAEPTLMTLRLETALSSYLYFVAYGAVLCVPLFLAWRSVSKHLCRAPLPPGPRLLPFVGNAFDIEASSPWVTYANWKEKYGDIVYSHILGQHIIIISSVQVARDLLEKRSAIYSDRHFFRAIEDFGLSFNTSFLPYGDTLRLHRKLFHNAFSPEASAEYHDLYLLKAYQLVVNLLSAPGQMEKHLETYAGSLILAATYGYEVHPEGDPVISRTHETSMMMGRILVPERAMLLMAFPFLEYLPSWFPGAADRRLAPYCRKITRQILDEPFEIAKAKIMGTGQTSSIVAKLLSHGDDDDISPAREEFIKGVAGSAFAAGTDTTASTLHTFMLAMLLYPDVQSRALAEINAVCGDNVPNFDHRSSLPYIDAICREVLRWQPITPLDLPHMTSRDDVYAGYLIPKGSLVMVNEWAISRDEHFYRDALKFEPQRHLTEDGKLKDGPSFVFGFGRRICPGRHFADLVLWAAMVSILSTVRIAQVKDSEGMDVPVIPEFTSGVVMHPKPFACAITSINPQREGQMKAASRVE